MSDSLDLINKLIPYLKDYKESVGNSDLHEFSIYLKDNLGKSEDSVKKKAFNKDDFHNYRMYPEIEFSALLTGLYRFSKHYLRKAFSTTQIKTIDEFGFLASLLKEGSLLKTELITKHLLEISSGSEIIKRLIRNELIYEFPDEKDKRAKRVSLTDKGRKEIFNAFDDMHKVSELIVGKLSQDELNEALQIFNKLNYHHHHIYDSDKKTSLINLHKKYVETPYGD